MHSVLLRVVRFFLRIWAFHVSAHCKLTTTTTSSTMLSYLTVTRPFSDPGSLFSPRREICQHLWSRTSWSLVCTAVVLSTVRLYVHLQKWWHSTSSLNQLPKVPVVSFCTTTRLLPHCSPTLTTAPRSGTFLHSLRLWRRWGSQAWLAKKFPVPNGPPLCLPSSSCRWLPL